MLGRHLRALQHELGLQRSRDVLERHLQPLQYELGLQDRHVLERQVRRLQHELGLQGQRHMLERQLRALQHQLGLQCRHVLRRHVWSLQHELGLQGRDVLEGQVRQLRELGGVRTPPSSPNGQAGRRLPPAASAVASRSSASRF